MSQKDLNYFLQKDGTHKCCDKMWKSKDLLCDLKIYSHIQTYLQVHVSGILTVFKTIYKCPAAPFNMVHYTKRWAYRTPAERISSLARFRDGGGWLWNPLSSYNASTLRTGLRSSQSVSTELTDSYAQRHTHTHIWGRETVFLTDNPYTIHSNRKQTSKHSKNPGEKNLKSPSASTRNTVPQCFYNW